MTNPSPEPSSTLTLVSDRTDGAPADAGRWRLMPSTRVLWRSPRSLQLELGDRAVVVDGIDRETVSQLAGGATDPIDSVDRLRVLEALDQAGFLSRQHDATARLRPTSASAARLAPDVTALAARFGDRAGDVMAARRRRRVAVHGGGRLPTLLAATLAAAGVGAVHVTESGEVGLRDVVPGGLAAADEGTRRAAAASAAIHRAAPEADTSGSASELADLVVVVLAAPAARSLSATFAHAGQPHLVIAVWAGTAVVGPLVVPGQTSCLTCADLQRRDRDPAWPALAAQLAATTDPSRAPSEVAVVSLAAAVGAAQALQYLDGEPPATMDGTLEFALPDWRLRRRTWPAHPDCGCAVSAAG